MNLMSRMKPIGRHIILVMIFGLVALTRLQHASAETGVVNDNQQRFSIAVPDFSDNSTSDGASWSTMAQVIYGASHRLGSEGIWPICAN
jgi:hypothetical protein